MLALLALQAIPALQAILLICIVIHMTVAQKFIDFEVVSDHLTDHLRALHAEFKQTVYDMEAENATSAAAAYYHAQLTCERFLSTPHCFD